MEGIFWKILFYYKNLLLFIITIIITYHKSYLNP